MPTRRPDIRKPEKSQLLDRLKTFLPAMKQANDALEDDFRNNGDAARERYDIETIDQRSEKVIQMDLHCGILEQKSKRAKSDAIKLPNGIRMDKDQSDDDDDEEGGDNDDEDEEQLEIRNQLLVEALSKQITENQEEDDDGDDDDDNSESSEFDEDDEDDDDDR